MIDDILDDDLEVPPWEANAAAVASWAPDDWVRWLFQVLYDRPRRFAPLLLAPDSDLPTELANLHRRAPAAIGETLKAGVVLAIHECPLTKDPNGLRILALIAARLRASRAVPKLVDTVLQNRAHLQNSGKARFAVMEDCLKVLAGFAPDDRVRVLFEGLMASNDVAPELSGVLLPPLVACNRDNPQNVRQYLDRFAARRKQIEGPYSDRFVILELFRAVMPETLRQRFKELSDDAQEYLIKHGGPLFERKNVFGIYAFEQRREPELPVGNFQEMWHNLEQLVPASGVLANWELAEPPRMMRGNA
ncbi:MAG: hypothetical protein ACLGH0_14730 [Thermoanaerobaculia bacterium]